MSDDAVGKSVLEVGADGSQFESAVNGMTRAATNAEKRVVGAATNMGKAVEGVGGAAGKSTAQQEAASKRFLASLEREANQLTMTRAEYRKLQAEQLGIAESVYAPLIRRIDEATAAQGRLAKGAQQANGELIQMRGGLQGVETAARATLARLGIGLSVAGFTTFLKSTNAGVLALKDLSEATGATIEKISQLEVVARRDGASFDTVTTSVVKLNQVLNAADGKNRVSLALRELGVDAEKLKTMDPADGVREVAQALQSLPDDGTKGRYILELFGKSAREMAPALKAWAEAGEVAASVNAEMVDEADRFEKSFAALNASAIDVSRSLAGPVVAAVNQLFDAVGGRGVGGADRISDLIVIPLQTASVVAANVAFVMRGIGNELGGIAAQAAAMARLDLSGARTIGEAMRKDAAAARSEFDALERRLLSIGRVLPQASYSNEGRSGITRSLRDLAALEEAQRKVEEAAKRRDIFGPMIRDIEDLITANERRIAGMRELTKAEELEVVLNRKLADSLKAMTKPQQDVARGAIEAARAAIVRAVASQRTLDAQIEEQRAAEKTLATMAAVAQHSTKLRDAEAATTAQTRQQLVALRARNDQLELGESVYSAHTAATMRAEAADLEWQAAMEGGNRYLEERARLLREMAGEEARGSALRFEAEATAAARTAAGEWDRTADGIRTALTDALRRGFESGESFGRNLAKTLENELKTRIAAALADSLVGLGLSLVGATQGGTNNANGLQAANTLAQVYSAGAKAYSLYAGSSTAAASGTVTADFIAGYKGATLAAGQAGPTTAGATGAMGAGSASGSAAAWLTTWGAAIALGIWKANQDYSAGFRRDQSKERAVELADRWGAPAKYMIGSGGVESEWANALSKMGFSDRLADLLSGATATAALFGRAAPRVESQGVTGTLRAGDFTGQAYADIIEKGGLFRSNKRYQEFAELPEEIGRMLDGAAAGVRDQAKAYGEALGLPVTQLDTVSTDIKIALTDDVEANTKALMEAMSGYGDELVKGYADAIKPLTIYGETTAQTFERVGSAMLGVNEALKQLGIDEFAKSITGAQSALGLADRFGGTDQLRAAAGTFAEAFTTEGEKVALLTARLTSELGELGLEMPTLGASADQARARYLDLVRAQDLNTAAGQDAFAILLGLSEAFDTVADRAESLQRDLSSAIAGAIEAFSPEARTRSQYERVAVDLADVGVTVSADQLIGATRDEIATFARAFVDLETNSIEARTAVATAAEALFGLKDAAADAQASINNRRTALEIELLRAQGREIEAVAREREAELAALRELDPALAAVKESIHAAADAARLNTAISAALIKFQSPQERLESGYESVARDLRGAGLSQGIPNLADILAGMSLQEVYSFAEAFIVAGDNSTEAKIAIAGAAGALYDLAMAARDIERADIQQQLADIADQFGDVTVIDDVEKLSEAFVRNRDEMKGLEDGLDDLLGRTSKTIQEVLADLLQGQKALQQYRGGALADAIEKARLGTLSPEQRIEAMRRNEESLFRQIDTSDDPVAVAQRLQDVIIDRIRLEADLRSEGLRDELTALERIRDISKELAQFTGSLRSSDLSPLSFERQLAESRALFEKTLEGAQAGDNDAIGNLIGNARAYLEEARAYFASGSGYSAIFNEVTGVLDAFGLMGSQTDPQIAALQALLDAVDDGSAETYAALQQIDGGLVAREAANNTLVNRQIVLAEDQLRQQQALVAEQRAQIAQWAQIARELKAELAAINDSTAGIRRDGQLASAQST